MDGPLVCSVASGSSVQLSSSEVSLAPEKMRFRVDGYLEGVEAEELLDHHVATTDTDD